MESFSYLDCGIIGFIVLEILKFKLNWCYCYICEKYASILMNIIIDILYTVSLARAIKIQNTCYVQYSRFRIFVACATLTGVQIKNLAYDF